MKIDLVLVWADPYLSDFLLEVACDIIQIVISVRLPFIHICHYRPAKVFSSSFQCGKDSISLLLFLKH